jgi:hypothetical protein
MLAKIDEALIINSAVVHFSERRAAYDGIADMQGGGDDHAVNWSAQRDLCPNDSLIVRLKCVLLCRTTYGQRMVETRFPANELEFGAHILPGQFLHKCT